MYQVQKRNGKNIDFNLSKISDAIKMAFEAQEKQYNQSIIDFIALKVTADFEPKIKEGLVSVEDIQDSVESVLVQAGYADVAKAYILYRRQREKLRNTESTILDFKKTVDDYVKINDWRVKENSTVTYSVGGLILSNSGAITANYWLSEIYDDAFQRPIRPHCRPRFQGGYVHSSHCPDKQCNEWRGAQPLVLVQADGGNKIRHLDYGNGTTLHRCFQYPARALAGLYGSCHCTSAL